MPSIAKLGFIHAIVDVDVIAAHKLMVTSGSVTDFHYMFKRELAYELCREQMERRSQKTCLRKSVRILLLCKREFCMNIKAISTQQSKRRSKGGVPSVLDSKIRRRSFFVDPVKS